MLIISRRSCGLSSCCHHSDECKKTHQRNIKDKCEAKGQERGPPQQSKQSIKKPIMSAMSMGPKTKTSTAMTIDALIMTLPATSAGIVTTIVRKTSTISKATPKGMTMTKNAGNLDIMPIMLKMITMTGSTGLHNPTVWTPSEI
jgi:hypothetical protein